MHLKCDFIKGSIKNGNKQRIWYSLVSNKPQDIMYSINLKHCSLKK